MKGCLFVPTAKVKSATLCAKQLKKCKLEKFLKYIFRRDAKRVSTFIQMPWQAVYVHTSSCLLQQTRTQIYLNTTFPQATLYRPNPS